METGARIKALLSSAEQEILSLVAEAATAGDYASLDFARSLAGELRLLSESAVSNSPSQQLLKGSRNGRADESGSGVPRDTLKSIRRGRSSRSKSKGGYPLFSVSEGCLVKTAWSKKKSNEYTHRAPLVNVVRILDHLDSVQAEHEVLTAEHCLSTARKSNVDFPSYHFYIILGLLREQNLALPIGREGFSLTAEWRVKTEQYLGLEEQ